MSNTLNQVGKPYLSIRPTSGWQALLTAGIFEYVAYAAAVTVIVFVAGAYAFKKMERRFADVI